MSERQFSLPDEVYQSLLAAAAMEGVSSVDWIATHLPPGVRPQPASVDISDLIGSVDSSRLVDALPPKTPFEEVLAAKMAKQGIYIP